MNEKDLRIVYMGTPEFAVAPLERLLENGYNIAGVITAPDKPAGRGKRIRFSPVKAFAVANHLRLFQPEKLKDESFLRDLKSIQPDLQVVVAFRMLPEAVWSVPALGTLNLHASLLPDYRGAAPINRVLINGETETGVTTFFIDHDIDTGRILLRKKVLIGEKENAGMLHDRLMAEGAGLVVETIRGIASGTIEPVPQDALLKNGGTLRTAPKISREDCHIDWSRSGKEVFNLVRGLSPYPGSFAYLEGESGENLLFKFHETEFLPGGPGAEPGTISTDDRTFLRVAVEDGWMGILELQQEGKRVMPVGQFLRGFSFSSFYPRFS